MTRSRISVRKKKWNQICQITLTVAPCKGIRIPEYGKFLHLESGILEIFVCGIRNPGPWNPEYRSRNPESH